jgi:enoyl-CoA hydratase/carnithine racemase
MQASDPGELPPGLPMLHAADLAEMPPPPLVVDGTGRPVEPLLVVDAREFAELPPPVRRRAVTALRGTRRATVAVSPGAERIPGELAQAVDLGLTAAAGAADARTIAVPDVGETLDTLVEQFAATPLAALTYVWLLRQSAGLPVPAALTAESAAYSTLLAGPEFARWLAARGPAREPDDRSHRVVSHRTGDVLHVRLDRPARRNAVDAAMRDALGAALAPAEWDPNLLVEISGSGPSFSAGGDLDEFGSAPDVAHAHVVRLAASVGELVHRIRDRVTFRVHGACMGAGFELPCFAGRVLAAPDTRLGLPEMGMGLIPGAGGTVSIVRRAGRWRAAWLGLTRARLDAGTARAWGLVDEVLDPAPVPADGADRPGNSTR